MDWNNDIRKEPAVRRTFPIRTPSLRALALPYELLLHPSLTPLNLLHMRTMIIRLLHVLPPTRKAQLVADRLHPQHILFALVAAEYVVHLLHADAFCLGDEEEDPDEEEDAECCSR